MQLVGVQRITKLTDRIMVLSHRLDQFSDQHKKGGNLNDLFKKEITITTNNNLFHQ